MDELQRLREENTRLKEELERIRNKCKHSKAYIIKKYELAGHHDKSIVIYRCPDCGKEFEGND